MRDLSVLTAGLLILLFTESHSYSAPVSTHTFEELLSPSETYNQAVDAVNQKLKDITPESLCPGANIAISCGNRKCEPDLGENEETCPMDCVSAPVKSYNSQTFCRDIKRVFSPSSIEQVQEEVRFAIQNGLHVRVLGNSHSVNGQLCTDGIVIQTHQLNHILQIENFHGQETVLVEPGVTLGDLMDWLDARGRTLGYATLGFRGVTVGGAIATGAHNSSTRHSAVISELVESIKLVMADGSVREFSEKDSDTFKALRTHLGMNGVAVQMRLRIQPQFNLHVKLHYQSDRNLFEKGALNEVQSCDFGVIHWFPQTGRMVKTCGTETSQKADPGASNVFLNPQIPSLLIQPYQLVLQLGACFEDLNVLIENLRYATFLFQPPFVKEDEDKDLVNSYELTGPSHKMMSSDLVAQGSNVYQMDWEFAVPQSQIQPALQEIRKILFRNNVSLPLTGVFIRFALTHNRSLLSHVTTGGLFQEGEPAALIDFPAYRPKGFSSEREQDYLRAYREISHLMLEKYHGRAHWGKNEDWIFEEENHQGSFGDKLFRFKQVTRQLDPNGVFSNDWSKKLVY